MAASSLMSCASWPGGEAPGADPMADQAQLEPAEQAGDHQQGAAPGDQTHREERARNAIELVATVLLAMATVLTAWSAFEATKWSGTQSIHFAQASALRTDSAKAASAADAEEVVDVNTFVAWAQALSEERMTNPTASIGPNGTYVPDPNTLSGFLYERFRAEFRPAVQAWLALNPLSDPSAPPTPFAMPQYRLADRQRADRLEAQANQQSDLARRDNTRGDNYVLTTVLFASVLFFAGVSSKLITIRARMITVGLAMLVSIAGVAILATFPVQV